jgi:hypothetical protein
MFAQVKRWKETSRRTIGQFCVGSAVRAVGSVLRRNSPLFAASVPMSTCAGCRSQSSTTGRPVRPHRLRALPRRGTARHLRHQGDRRQRPGRDARPVHRRPAWPSASPSSSGWRSAAPMIGCSAAGADRVGRDGPRIDVRHRGLRHLHYPIPSVGARHASHPALLSLVPMAGTIAAAPVAQLLVERGRRGYVAAGGFFMAGAEFAGLTQLHARAPSGSY